METFTKFIIGVVFVFLVIKLLKEIGKWNPPVSSIDINGMPHKHGAGIGGWLLFLVFTLAITGPLFSLGLVAISFAHLERETPLIMNSSLWIGFKVISWFFAAISVALSIYTARELLIKRHKKVVGKVIKLIWISGPGMGVFAFLVLSAYTYAFIPDAATNSSNFIGFISDIFKSAASATIWTLYLRMSRRVKNTYGC